MKKTCAAVAIAGGLVLAAGPANADILGGGSSTPSTGSAVVDNGVQLVCALVTGITGSGASVIGSSVPAIPGCS
ncbi:hypothetical protein [Nocardia macrotermitis]|uniref:Chaplin n=1 Tax=Nocardia macrotermitis TaxID=2585198 RepID=A0A7K0D7T4_9NOCA|nr:hypothetical protein [Nocardia macrotermitis]MQY21826.1 hypothetical protein [Nocardia macrotermitis]